MFGIFQTNAGDNILFFSCQIKFYNDCFQINEEKSAKKEMEFELRREIEELSRTCSEQQQLIHHVRLYKVQFQSTPYVFPHTINQFKIKTYTLKRVVN